MQHTGKLEQQEEGVVKSLLNLDLVRPHIDIGLVLELLLVQVLKAAEENIKYTEYLSLAESE